MNLMIQRQNAVQARQTFTALLKATAFVSMLILPELAFAQPAGDTDFEGRACGVLDSVRSLLNMASVAVVTIAIVFAGYQIAFAHKRIGDVAPILIGGLLIGAASQLAKWIMPDREGDDCEAAASLLPVDGLHEFASAAAQTIQHLV